MATEVKIPNLGYTMTKAKILNWLKSVGDKIEAGEILLEIETDKVNYGIESPESGVIKAILAEPGEEIPVGGVVAIIGRADEKIEMPIPVSEKKEVEASHPGQEMTKKDLSPPSISPATGRRLISPLARKVGKAKGVDFSQVAGSGRSGRIRLADVEKYLSGGGPKRIEPPPPAIAASLPHGIDVSEVIPMTTMRRTIANRLSQSSHDAPHFNLWTEVDMTEIGKVLGLLKDSRNEKDAIRYTVTDIFIKAVAVGLRDHSRLNSRLHGDQIEILKDINVGVAVALDEGLIVPAIEKADQKCLSQIAQERQDLVERAQQGRLALQEIERGTFTISNLGMYDIIFFTSILNPPQSGILSIGKTQEQPVVREGAILIRPILKMSLAIDHRSVDGVTGAKFLQDLKKSLENPVLLI